MRTLIFIAMLCASMIPAYAFANGDATDAGPDAEAAADSGKDGAEGAAADGKEAEGAAKEPGESKEAADAGFGDPQFTGDKRIKLLMYDEADVYTITTRYGYQTNIVFAPQEEIELISVGDRSMWQIIPTGNRMFIRPMDEDVTTNMTVLTNRRSYQFDLKSVAADKTSGNIYVAKFVYDDHKKDLPLFGGQQFSAPVLHPPVVQSPPLPTNAPFGVGPSVPNTPPPVASNAPPVAQQANQPPPGAWQPAPDAAPVPAETMAAIAPEPQPAAAIPAAPAPAAAPPQAVYPNYSYTYAGPDDLAPLQVYDDGKFTYLKYRDLQKPPSIYVVDRAGKENPVQFNVKGDFVVVEAVAGEIALRNGADTVHIYNEVLNPG